MKTNTPRRTQTGQVHLRSVDRETCVEYFFTATDSDAGAAFESAAAHLAQKCVQPIQEKIYGLSEARERILAARAVAYGARGVDPSPPATFVDGRSLGGSEFTGLQIWGVAPKKRGEVLVQPAQGSGRCWTGRGFRLLHLPYVRGTRADGSLPDCVTQQAVRMFANAASALRANGLTYTRVARTWIYLARILDWYGEFNRIRSAHHQAEGIGGPDGAPFPASTGIQGRSTDEECFMDVLAVEGASVRPIMKTDRQDSAFSYGSAFSRGMGLEIEGRKTVFVSGTASIDEAGRTLHPQSAELQCVETLLGLGAVVAAHGGTMADIVSATLFCKKPEAAAAYERVCRLLGLPPLPIVAMEADVCRAELLLEIEAVAVIPA